MSSAKVFIALLFLVAILFVVGINLGAAHTDNQIFQTPTWLTSLGGVVAHPQPLKLGDLSLTPASCLQQGKFVVPMGNTCTFAIKQSSFALRVVSLQLIQGTGAVVMLVQEKTLPVQDSLAGLNATTKDDLKVYPGKAHAELSIQCTGAGGGSACFFQLK